MTDLIALVGCPPTQALPSLSVLELSVLKFDQSSIINLLFPGLSAIMVVALSMMPPQRTGRRLSLAVIGVIASCAGYYLAELVFAGWLHSLEMWQATAERAILETPNIPHFTCVNSMLDNQSYAGDHQLAADLQVVSWLVMWVGYLIGGAVFIQAMKERYGQRLAVKLARLFGLSARKSA